MMRALCTFAVFTAAALLPMRSVQAQAKQVLHYQGTIGQRHAALTLEVEGDTLAAARYRIDQQPGEIEAAEMRVFGTTIVMADDEGNLFHLHLQDSAGHAATDLKHAEALGGTMQRGEDIDLAVKLRRVGDVVEK